jgi:hypothetical protein
MKGDFMDLCAYLSRITAFVFCLNQRYGPVAGVAEALVPPDAEELAVLDADFADGEGAGVAHVVHRGLLAAAAYVPA